MARRVAHGLLEDFSDGEALHPVSRLWVFRVLVKLGGYKRFVQYREFENDDLARQLGLGSWLESEDKKIQPKPVKARLDTLYAEEEQEKRKRRLPDMLQKNIDKLGALIGLSDVDLKILAFSIMVRMDSLLGTACNYLGDLDMNKLIHALSVILALPKKEVSEALQPRGLLAQSGLLTVDKRHNHTMESKIDLMSNGFADLMSSVPLDLPNLMREAITLSSEAKLTLDNYAYLASFIQVMKAYLRQAFEEERKGVNILLYGRPGTGKSELARVIAKELDCSLFEVSSEDNDGDPRDGEQRMWSYATAQCLFAKQKKTLLVFDEVEDIFRGGLFTSSVADQHKAWINRTLETNPVPTIWLSNSVRCLDSAFVRRFDLVHEIPVPPKSMREKIISDAAEGMLEASAIKRLAESEHLSPAVVTRSASVVKAVQASMPENLGSVMETLIDSTMTAQGLKRIAPEDPARLPDVYDPAFINTDIDMADLAAGIKHTRSARICLYGPAGTGKTAFGRWLAGQLEVPLIVRRASDIWSKFLGESEANIARAFQEAESEQAVLLIDEVDSFLRDRRLATKSWEVSVVNELLTQMEAYAGVFIASTNLMDDLDEASLRRFDLKVKFGHLRPDQAQLLFTRHCAALDMQPGKANLASVQALRNLAPGDFAAVLRQSRFRPLKTADDFAAALLAECALKRGSTRSSIGFV